MCVCVCVSRLKHLTLQLLLEYTDFDYWYLCSLQQQMQLSSSRPSAQQLPEILALLPYSDHTLTHTKMNMKASLIRYRHKLSLCSPQLTWSIKHDQCVLFLLCKSCKCCTIQVINFAWCVTPWSLGRWRWWRLLGTKIIEMRFYLTVLNVT